MTINTAAITGPQASTEKTNTTAGNAGKKLADDFTNFLTLLTKQLQFQDPLDPLDSNEFTQQLVSFTQVEQSVQQNKNLEGIMAQIQSQNMSNAVDYLGKEITIGTNKAGITDGKVNWEYILASTADDVKVTIKDKAGKVLHTTTSDNEVGRHNFSWTPPEGTKSGEVFTLEIIAKTGKTKINTDIYSKGKVDSIETYKGEILLSSNGILTSPRHVIAVK
jgi:flagellar basal-body rod modification protein FlgD